MKKYTMIRVLVSSWKKLKVLAKLNRRSQLLTLDDALSLLEKDLIERNSQINV